MSEHNPEAMHFDPEKVERLGWNQYSVFLEENGPLVHASDYDKLLQQFKANKMPEIMDAGGAGQDESNRCLALDGKYFDGIEFRLILEDGKPRPHWRCHKSAGHSGWHSTHNDCGAPSFSGVVCGLEPDHLGNHSWESSAVPSGFVFPLEALQPHTPPEKEASTELPPLPYDPANVCTYCGTDKCDHKHGNGHGCCGNCCASHGMLTHPQYDHGEYEFVQQVVIHKNLILELYFASLRTIQEQAAEIERLKHLLAAGYDG